jgi:hypothetical protein
LQLQHLLDNTTTMSDIEFIDGFGYTQRWSLIDFNNGGYDPCAGWMQPNSRFAWDGLKRRGRQDRLRAFIKHQDDQAVERKRAQSRTSSKKHRNKQKTRRGTTTVTPLHKSCRSGHPATAYHHNTPLPTGIAASPSGTIGPGAANNDAPLFSRGEILDMLGKTAANQQKQAKICEQTNKQVGAITGAVNQLLSAQKEQQAVNANVQRRLHNHGRLQARQHQELQQFKAKVGRYLGPSFDEAA